MLYRVIDSRGVSRSVPPPSVGAMSSRQKDLSDARMNMRGAGGTRLRLVIAVVIGATIGAASWIAADKSLGPQDRIGSVVVALIVAVLTGYGGWRLGVRAPRIEGVAERLRRCRLCLCCGYDLEGLTPESDGCTVCPECGGAWALGDSG